MNSTALKWFSIALSAAIGYFIGDITGRVLKLEEDAKPVKKVFVPPIERVEEKETIPWEA